MKTMQTLVVSAALAIAMAAPTSAAQSDPEIIVYRVPGVRDTGIPALMGTATVFHCTNFSGATENIRFVTRRPDGGLASNNVVAAPHLSTRTAGTHEVLSYTLDLDLATGAITQGTTAIAATSINVICTAETIDASTAAPVGVAKRSIRFSPVPGSQE